MTQYVIQSGGEYLCKPTKDSPIIWVGSDTTYNWANRFDSMTEAVIFALENNVEKYVVEAV